MADTQRRKESQLLDVMHIEIIWDAVSERVYKGNINYRQFNTEIVMFGSQKITAIP
jgi:hypothetical protein